MDFFSATEVVNRRYSKAIKILLGAICFLDGLVIVVELLTAGTIGGIFIVPLIILVPAFLKLGPKKYTADVLCKVCNQTESVALFMSNVVIDKNAVLSRNYIIQKSELFVFENQELGKLFLVGTGKVELLDQRRTVVYEQDFFKETIELTVKKTTYKELVDYFKPYMNQKS